MEIKTTDEEIARFVAICVSGALSMAKADLTGEMLINLKNAIKSDIEHSYHKASKVYDELLKRTFYDN